VRILIDYRPALRARTGVGEYVHELACALGRVLTGLDTLTLFSSSWKDRVGGLPVPGARVIDARVPVRILNLLWHRVGWPPVERFTGAIDVAHSPSPLLIPARNAARVITIHDLDFLDHPERTRAEIRRDYAPLARRHAMAADAVVAVSRFTAAEVERRLGVAPTQISICSPGAPSWPARSAPRPNGPILFMGTLEARKNIGVLLRAYARLIAGLPSAPTLILAGGATRAAREWLRGIGKPPLAGRVEHLGYVEGERRYELYRRASMLVLPSHNEGFGLPVLEAMTVGVPVIVSNRGALPEVAGNAGLVVEPDDDAALAAAMKRYLTDPATAAAASARGLVRARNYSWDASAASLYRAYSNAVERRRTLPA
jgi:glycosyltransferase involved in cell wall biosynthesis